MRQVHNSEFERKVNERLTLAAQEKNNAVQLAEVRGAGELQRLAGLKDAKIQ